MTEDDKTPRQEEVSSQVRQPAKKTRRHLIRPKWLRITLKTLMWLVVAVLLIPVLLYIPPVQTLVKDIACDQVYKATGMKIAIDRFRLKWPLDVSLAGVSVVEASGDTMVYAKEVVADVKMAPLLNLDVRINRLDLIDGQYRMVSPDSSMILKIKAGLLTVDDRSSADIANMRILLNKAYLKDGDLSLFMDVWKQKPSPADSTSTPVYIEAGELRLDNFTFAMSMLPTIDTLRLNAGRLLLRKGKVDLARNLVTASSLSVDGGDMTYLSPTPEYVKEHPAPAPDTVSPPSPPMVIKGDTVSLSRFKALYAMKGASPLPGFDPSYIEADDVNVSLRDFYNAASTIRLPITSVTARERSGLQITGGHGTFSMDSTGMAIRGFVVKTLFSDISASAGLPFALMEMKPDAPLDVTASGSLGMPDIEAFMPAVKEFTSKIPRRLPLDFDIKADGTLGNAAIRTLSLSMPGTFSLEADGDVQNALDFKELCADIDFEGSVTNPGIADNLLGKAGVRLPRLSVRGNASARRQAYAASFRMLTSDGDLAADGRVSLTSEAYNADVAVRNLNVSRFMPTLGVGPVTASLKAHGAGFNPEKAGAASDISVDIASLAYQKQILKDITASLSLHDGVYSINAYSANDAADFHVEGTGTVGPDLYTFDVSGQLDRIDLHALGLTPETNAGRADLSLSGTASPGKWIYDILLKTDSVEWTAGNQYFRVPDPLTLRFKSYADNVTADIDASLTSLSFNSPTGLKELIGAFSAAADSVSGQVERKNLNVETLQAALPPFAIDMNASGKGVLGRYMNTVGLHVDTIYARIANDSLITGHIGIHDVGNASTYADTILLGLSQRGQLLDYKLHMGNRRNNPVLSEFADVDVNGYLGENRGLVSLTQKNQKGETGYRLGLTAALADSLLTVHFTPRKATIAYLPWMFNIENHVDYNLYNKRINANLLAESNESSIHLVTQPGKRGNDELNMEIKNLKVQDFLKLSVFAPPLTASVNANLKVGYSSNWLYGGGDVGVTDFTYDKLRVGDMNLKLGAAMNDDGTSAARATLKIDGADAMTARVRLRPDSATKELTPEKVGLDLTRFPLYIANAFLGNDVARLSGYLTGSLDMKGSFTEPLMSGSVACDSVGVFIPMIGSQLRFNNDSVLMADNIVRFNEFDIWGANRNPIRLNGTVDATRFSNIMFDLAMDADNFQLINNDKKARSDIFGKLFLDLKATAKGPMNHFNINADLDILSGSDVTYSISETSAELKQQDMGDVVKFVNFNDTTKIAKADTVAPAMAMRIVAGLTIEPGTVVTVNLPGTATMGSGKAQLNPSGTLNYFQNYMGDMKLNGQLDLGEGYVRYSMPMGAGDKKFTFNPASYVLFNGDIMNPTLNIMATDQMKANLLQDGNSRIVNFLVHLNVTQTLASPKVLFDLSTDDDMTIQNDLLSMSPDQRSMAAINLLLTGQYNQQGIKTASSDLLSASGLTSKLYGMLTGQLNSWLANNVKGVDLSFGVDQYDKTVNGQTGTATSYSYTMSKSMFNNRFKISVGGNYTTDASADENFAENLINDISFEYILKQTTNTTMYLRLFRHTGYESILEGEITEMGGGFVYKRRLSSLRDLFRRAAKNMPAPVPADSVPARLPDAARPHTDDNVKPSSSGNEDN